LDDTLKQFSFKRVFKHKGQVIIDLKKEVTHGERQNEMNVKQTVRSGSMSA